MRRLTQRLVLRDFVEGEVLTWHADPRYQASYAESPDPVEIVRRSIEWSREVPRRHWQVGVELDGVLIGCAGFRFRNGAAELGVEIDPDHWRRGYARECLVSLMELARELGHERIEARTTAANTKAQALAASVGLMLHVE